MAQCLKKKANNESGLFLFPSLTQKSYVLSVWVHVATLCWGHMYSNNLSRWWHSLEYMAKMSVKNISSLICANIFSITCTLLVWKPVSACVFIFVFSIFLSVQHPLPWHSRDTLSSSHLTKHALYQLFNSESLILSNS